MAFFDDIQQKINDAVGQGGVGDIGQNISDAADNVLQNADDITNQIPGDVDNNVVDWVKEQKDKLGGN